MASMANLNSSALSASLGTGCWVISLAPIRQKYTKSMPKDLKMCDFDSGSLLSTDMTTWSNLTANFLVVDVSRRCRRNKSCKLASCFSKHFS
uniref:Uncharacterized protein n=1 Tax=Romanomermis culicivorax TaxID=13658 RepID=A0A915IXN4_ROMCU